MPRLAFALLTVGLAFAAPQAKAACLLPDAKPMLILTFYFGENIPNRAPLTAAQWQNFLAQTVTPAFPDGLTVTDGQGQWMNPQTKNISDDPTKILTIAVPDSPNLPAKIEQIITTYKTTYHQQSVGITTTPSCARF